MTVGTDRQIKYSHVWQAVAIETPGYSTVGGVVNTAVSPSVEMARICRIDHKGVHRHIGKRGNVDRCPSDRACAGTVKIGRLPNVLPCDSVTIKDDVCRIRIVWIDN